MARVVGMGSFKVRLGDGETDDEFTEKHEQCDGAVAEAWNDLSGIELAGMPASAATLAIGAENAFGNGLLITMVLFSVNKAMGNPLTLLGTMWAGEFVVMAIQFEGESMQGVEVGEKERHGLGF